MTRKIKDKKAPARQYAKRTERETFIVILRLNGLVILGRKKNVILGFACAP